jgi:hypothetical protein
MAILRSFDRFRDEAALVGKMLAGYADLEIDLMHCVNSVRHNTDEVLRAMFGERGEARRINLARDLGRQLFEAIHLQAEFALVIAGMHYCRLIRNQYAHCVWWDDNTPRLAFAAVEDIATQDVAIPAQLGDLAPDHVTVEALENQLAYFNYTDDLMIWLIQQSLRAQGRQFHPGVVRPPARQQPPLRIP